MNKKFTVPAGRVVYIAGQKFHAGEVFELAPGQLATAYARRLIRCGDIVAEPLPVAPKLGKE